MGTGEKPCLDTSALAGAHRPTGQVVAVGYSREGVLFAQTREPASLWRADTERDRLASDSRADTGHLIFHTNSGGGIACASCHPEGGEDGRTWNFVCTGGRRTQSLRGGISPTAPFHWDGSEFDLSYLLDDVFSGRMAGPLLSDDQKGALQAWVDTIPAAPQVAGLDEFAVARGKSLFWDATVGCGSCHSGPSLTSNTTVDVGTGRAFQVPSLRGLPFRAPFLHDGCARDPRRPVHVSFVQRRRQARQHVGAQRRSDRRPRYLPAIALGLELPPRRLAQSFPEVSALEPLTGAPSDRPCGTGRAGSRIEATCSRSSSSCCPGSRR